MTAAGEALAQRQRQRRNAGAGAEASALATRCATLATLASGAITRGDARGFVAYRDEAAALALAAQRSADALYCRTLNAHAAAAWHSLAGARDALAEASFGGPRAGARVRAARLRARSAAAELATAERGTEAGA